ncbi:1-acyl-sn-glycerol-3-phosphate acyltransferase [Acinetobacter colistiniresistens]|uniref:1-acyl-sn-glycerol-3-phosphate acyltransferase n=1 Tax=Acinetobacter colistiniresistens TaxID=280145 RepID=UPI000BDF4C57|nr:1-acyl-sn-glycerol-3-phosphate acyltransferase [Acinetobacter colistiniresistens]
MSQDFPDLPPLVPQRGSLYSRTLCKKIFLSQGWTVVGEIPNLPKAVAIISPHTSNIDGWYGFLAIGGLGLKITVLGKDILFKPPLKPLLNWAGLIPVHRDSAHGLTEQVVASIRQHDKIWIGMAPEGTRKKAKKMKSGFYHIAHAAGIPIVMFAFDYDHKTIYCLGAFIPTGHYQQDLEQIMQCYVGHFSPKNPHWLAAPLQKLVKKN